jgi:hypothetical protein
MLLVGLRTSRTHVLLVVGDLEGQELGAAGHGRLAAVQQDGRLLLGLLAATTLLHLRRLLMVKLRTTLKEEIFC